MTIRGEGNTLHFMGKTGDDVLPATAALHNLITKQGYKDITLDFTQSTYLSPSYMLPLAATARSYRLDKVDFEILMPAERKQAGLMQNTNWAHLISPETFEARDEKNINHLSAVQYLNADDQFNAVDRSMNVILQNSPGLDRSRLKALEWSLNEITDNVLNHAESKIGGIVQVVTYPKKQCVEFYVCDAGIGIPRSLRQGRPEIDNDVRAVRAAIEEGITRNGLTNQGNGLFGTFKCCEVSRGEFDVLTGMVRLAHKPGELQASKNDIPFHGTFIRASINYGYEMLLEKALIFKGKHHDPATDYIERIYEDSPHHIKFQVATELDAFGSRTAGVKARTKIENLMNNRRDSILFNFENIHLISSSFADEVFGRLFVELGPLSFSQLCKFEKVEPTVKRLIDRAIEQRMKQ